MTFFDISRKMLKAGFYKYRLYFLCNLSATALFCCFAVISTNRTFMNASIVNSSISNNIYLPFFLSAVFLNASFRLISKAPTARALIVIVSVQMGVAVAGLEMRAMVGSVKDNSILIQTLFFQFFHQLAEVLVEACALSQIIRILFCCIAAQSLQVFGEDKIRKSLLRAVGPS